MILKKEVATIAEEKGVTPTTIDKDWVLGHVLDAIYSISICRESLIFKGGTCLKKCYFPDYRFSEDLDFTSINKDFVLDEKLINQIIEIVKERTGIPLHLERVEALKFKDQLTGYAAVIKFWGQIILRTKHHRHRLGGKRVSNWKLFCMRLWLLILLRKKSFITIPIPYLRLEMLFLVILFRKFWRRNYVH
jgi:hypothetical protein